MKERLENLKKTLGVTWGEVAEYIGISRSMLDFLRSGERSAGNKTLQQMENAEARAIKENPTIPTFEKRILIPDNVAERIAIALERIATALEKGPKSES